MQFGIKTYLGGTEIAYANVKLELVLMSASQGRPLRCGQQSDDVRRRVQHRGRPVAHAARGGHGRRDGHALINPAHLASIRREGGRYLLLGAVACALLAATAPLAVPLDFGDARPKLSSWCGAHSGLPRVQPCESRPRQHGRSPVGRERDGGSWPGGDRRAASVLLPRFGALGAAITSMAAYATSALVALAAMRRLARKALCTLAVVSAAAPEALQGVTDP